MEINWLWDSRLSEDEVKSILKDETHPKFDIYAEKLFSRMNDVQKAFGIIDRMTFCRKWPGIKKRMEKDKWLKNRIIFWQAIYDRVKEKMKEEGVKIRQPISGKIPFERKEIAKQIRRFRVSIGYSQKEMASKLGVIQQYISKIESGRQNLSIDTLIRIASVFGKKVIVKLR